MTESDSAKPTGSFYDLPPPVQWDLVLRFGGRMLYIPKELPWFHGPDRDSVMRWFLERDGKSYKEIAEMFGVDERSVRRAIGRSWKRKVFEERVRVPSRWFMEYRRLAMESSDWLRSWWTPPGQNS